MTTTITKEQLINSVGDFTWDFSSRFFIETQHGNFVWDDPEYNGDNTIRLFDGSIQEFFGNEYGRDKGKHIIKDYIDDVESLELIF